MSHITARFAHYMSDYEGVMIPVQVFDATSKQVFAKPVPLSSDGSRLDQDFGPGTYLIRAALPSGEILADTVAVQSGKDGEALFRPKRQSPREELSWAYYLQQAPHQAQEIPLGTKFTFETAPERPQIIFWAHEADGWKTIRENAPDVFTGVQYDDGQDLRGALLISISFREDWERFPAQIWLQARTRAGSVFSALPTVAGLHVLVVANDLQSGLPCHIQSSNGTGAVDAMLSFLSSGDFESARAIGSGLVELAKQLLYDKMSDPMAATVGGYFLLQAGEFDRLHEWTANLANRFRWLPDGPVIRACHLMTRPEPDAAAIRRLLLEAVGRGLPYYTIGLRLLQNALKLLLQRSTGDSQIAAAIEAIKPYLEAADSLSRATSFTGESPSQPQALWRQRQPRQEPDTRLENRSG
jgi:hypothetical protein